MVQREAWRQEVVEAGEGARTRDPGGPRPRRRMGRWLPYDSYRSDLDMFTNLDSIGFCLEYIPQSGADASMQQTLHSIYQRLPPGCCVQTSGFASPNIRDLLAEYANLRMLDADAREQAIKWGRPARNSQCAPDDGARAPTSSSTSTPPRRCYTSRRRSSATSAAYSAAHCPAASTT